MKRKFMFVTICIAATAVLTAVYTAGWFNGNSGQGPALIKEAEAAGGMVTGPNTIAPDRYVYYPGTETLAKDEVRVIATGTGMPDQRRGQASASFVFEFGNGEKLIFDIGSGSMRNINALMIPPEFLTKVFISHLHTDHWADLNALWAGGWTAGRPVPLEVWGPSGATPEMGTAYAIDGFMRAFNWDYRTRAFKITPILGDKLYEMGYKRVYILFGGWMDWQENNYPSESLQ